MNDYIEKVYSVAFMFRVILFAFYLLSFAQSLNNIKISLPITTTYTFEKNVNFYALVAVVIAIAAFITLVGVNVVGSGVNDTSTSMVAKTVGFLSFMAITTISDMYFLNVFVRIGITFLAQFVEIFIWVMMLIRFLLSFGGSE